MSNFDLPPSELIDRLAEFWEDHDLVDFITEMKPVVDTIFERDTIMMLSLDIEEAQQIQRLAAQKGMDEADLIRAWIQEKLAEC
ncbi:MAG: hypothetical protein ACTS2F_00045 [Thainema sp.]